MFNLSFVTCVVNWFYFSYSLLPPFTCDSPTHFPHFSPGIFFSARLPLLHSPVPSLGFCYLGLIHPLLIISTCVSSTEHHLFHLSVSLFHLSLFHSPAPALTCLLLSFTSSDHHNLPLPLLSTCHSLFQMSVLFFPFPFFSHNCSFFHLSATWDKLIPPSSSLSTCPSWTFLYLFHLSVISSHLPVFHSPVFFLPVCYLVSIHPSKFIYVIVRPSSISSTCHFPQSPMTSFISHSPVSPTLSYLSFSLSLSPSGVRRPQWHQYLPRHHGGQCHGGTLGERYPGSRGRDGGHH